MTGGPHLAGFSRDVGFHGCPPVTLYRHQVFLSMVVYTLYTQGPKFVDIRYGYRESYIDRLLAGITGRRQSPGEDNPAAAV